MQLNAKILAGVVITCVSILGTARGQTAFWQDGFETYTAGSTAPSPWIASGAGDVVATSQHYAGAQALEMDGTQGGCWSGIAYRPIPITNGLYIEFEIRPSANHVAGCHPWCGLIGLSTTANWTTAQGRWLLTLHNDSTNAILGGYPGQTGTPILGSWSYDQWRKIGMLYQTNSTSAVLTYFIDGNRFGPYSFALASYESSLAYLAFDSGDGTTWIDNVMAAPASSAPATAPTWTLQPSNQVVSAGSGFTFTAQSAGYPTPTYQWQFSTNGSTFVNIDGATGSSYSLGLSGLTNIGFYRVVAANSQATIYSSVVTLGFIDLKMLASVYLTGAIGSHYEIDAASALAPTNWAAVTNLTLPTQPYIYVDYTSITNKQQYYRAVPQ